MNDSLTIRDTIYEVSKFLNVAKKDIWNANKIRNKYVSDIPPEDNQFLLFNSFSNEYQFDDYAKNAAEVTYGEYDIDSETQPYNLPIVYRTIRIIGTTTTKTDVYFYGSITLPENGIEHIIINDTNNSVNLNIEVHGLSGSALEIATGEHTHLLYAPSTSNSGGGIWRTI